MNSAAMDFYDWIYVGTAVFKLVLQGSSEATLSKGSKMLDHIWVTGCMLRQKKRVFIIS